MQEMPTEFYEWTELKFPSGMRYLKESAPDDIRNKAIEWERTFYEKTGRRRIINVEIGERSKTNG